METILIFKPKKENINFHGEWVFQIGAMCYGVMCRKKDNKVMITYNINPDNLHPDHFDRITQEEVPSTIYKMFQQKLSKDIEWTDTTMINLTKNKGLLNVLFNFAEDMKTKGTSELPDAQEYTQEDSLADNKEKNRIQTTTKLNFKNTKKKKNKAAKIARKVTKRQK